MRIKECYTTLHIVAVCSGNHRSLSSRVPSAQEDSNQPRSQGLFVDEERDPGWDRTHGSPRQTFSHWGRVFVAF